MKEKLKIIKLTTFTLIQAQTHHLDLVKKEKKEEKPNIKKKKSVSIIQLNC